MGNNGDDIIMGFIPIQALKDILDSGLIIVGNRKCGKTNGAKVILNEFLLNQEQLRDEYPHLKFRILDTVFNWRYNFVKIPYFRLNDESLDNLENVSLYKDNLIIDVDFIDSDIAQEVISELIEEDYKHKKELKLKYAGMVSEWSLYVVEEAQDIIGTYALMKDTGKFWLKMVSEGRNFGLNFIFIGQRMADISPKAVERCQGYLLGRITGDNDKRKIRNVANKEIMSKCMKLHTGEFIYWNGEKGFFVKFPKFESSEKPYELQIKTQQVKWEEFK